MIYIKTAKEIEAMRLAGKILAETHEIIEDAIKPGITTKELDQIAEDYIRSQGAKPAFLGLYGFPACINASINDELIHGIPSSERKLKEGDIISIDIGTLINGFHGDAARTHAVGEVSAEALRLIRITRESFFEGLKMCREGNRLSDISNAVQTHVESHGYSVVREFAGHGIGRALHEDPQVLNYGPKGRGPRLQAGMAIAIEPMVNSGSKEIFMLDDGWTIVSKDRKLTAHYENTVIITGGIPEITTLTSRERKLDLMGDICRV